MQGIGESGEPGLHEGPTRGAPSRVAHREHQVGRATPFARRGPFGDLASDSIGSERDQAVRRCVAAGWFRLAPSGGEGHALANELSIHIDTWGPGINAHAEDTLGDLLSDLHEALERLGARGTITSMGGLAGGPAVSFGLEATGVQPGVLGRIVDRACSIFLEACTEVGFEHGGIARLDVQTMRYLDLSLEQPAEAFAGAAEVAELFGVSRQRVHELRRKRSFPAPAAELAAGPVWRVSTLQRFLAEWDRKPGRPHTSARA